MLKSLVLLGGGGAKVAQVHIGDITGESIHRGTGFNVHDSRFDTREASEQQDGFINSYLGVFF